MYFLVETPTDGTIFRLNHSVKEYSIQVVNNYNMSPWEGKKSFRVHHIEITHFYKYMYIYRHTHNPQTKFRHLGQLRN